MPRTKISRNETADNKVISLSSAKGALGEEDQSRAERLEEEIRQRAYELYEQRGRMPGRESEDWLTAEQEIVARYQQRMRA